MNPEYFSPGHPFPECERKDEIRFSLMSGVWGSWQVCARLRPGAVAAALALRGAGPGARRLLRPLPLLAERMPGREMGTPLRGERKPSAKP